MTGRNMAGSAPGQRAGLGGLSPHLTLELVPPVSGPRSNQPELFPRSATGPGERVLFATRPSFLAGFWGRTFILALLLFILLLPVKTAGVSYAENPVAWFLIGCVLFFVYVVYQQWHHALYALTNQRLVRVSGWRGRGVDSVPIGDVLSVNSGSSSGGAVLFRYRVPSTPRPGDPSGFQVRTFAWPAVSDPLEAAAWIQKMLGAAQAELRAESKQGWNDQRVAAVTVTCPYCGGRSTLDLIDSQHPVCPLCSAPLVLPGTGNTRTGP